MDDVEAELAELRAQLAEKDALLARANARADQAELEVTAASNRLERAAGKELERRTRALLESFLSVVDDLDRAIAAAHGPVRREDVIHGLELVRRSVLTQLGRFGVVPAPALGAPFDPERHEAVAMVPVSDPAQVGRVLDVMRAGYLLGDQTLRPAGVAVGQRARHG